MTTHAPPAPPVGALPMPHVDGVEHEWVTVDGVRLHLATAGDPDAEPLLLLHGWPQHWWTWRALIPPLAEHYRVIAPDFRGMGWSDAPRSGYHLEDLSDDVLKLLDARGISTVKVVGHDWGLGVGYTTALRAPERIDRLVVIGGPHFWSARGAPPALYARTWHVFVNASPLGAFATRRLGAPEACLRYWRSAGTYTREEIEIFTAPLRRPASAHATVQRYRTFLTRELGPYFRGKVYDQRLRVPTLHLNGADDPLVQGIGDQWREHADDMRYELVEGVGHFLHEEAPDIALERIGAFLDEAHAGQPGGNGVAPSGRRPSTTIAR